MKESRKQSSRKESGGVSERKDQRISNDEIILITKNGQFHSQIG